MTRRILAGIVLLAVLACLAGCSSVSVGSFASKYYNDDAYDDAVQEVIRYIKENFQGCTLKEIGYAGDAAVKAEAEARGLAPEQIIVLKTTFVTDKEDHHNGLEPDHTYEDYMWILTRSTSADLWEHKDHGYG